MAHITGDVEFLDSTGGKVQRGWAAGQVATTADFSHGSWLWTQFSGGLNYQVPAPCLPIPDMEAAYHAEPAFSPIWLCWTLFISLKVTDEKRMLLLLVVIAQMQETPVCSRMHANLIITDLMLYERMLLLWL